MLTFTVSKDADFLRISVGGNTYPVRDGLKALGFRWGNGVWSAAKLIDESADIGAWLEGIIRAFPGERWVAPEWLSDLILEVRADQLGRDPIDPEPEIPLFDLENVL